MGADSFSRGTRDNGLRCAGYTPVADLDPRIADALLETLRDEGIAAYAAPTPGTPGGYGEVALPTRPLDRLWADAARLDRARELVTAETHHEAEVGAADRPAGTAADGDFDTAWQQVLSSLRTPTTSTAVRPWPSSEEVDPTRRYDDETDLDEAIADSLDDDGPVAYSDVDEHFVPPPAPPLPRLRSVTIGAVLAIAFGILAIVTNLDGGNFRVPAFLAIVGGAGSLVWNMRQGPPTDSGWDDGAVV